MRFVREADADDSKLQVYYDSPFGRNLLNRTAGEEVVNISNGLALRIIEVPFYCPGDVPDLTKRSNVKRRSNEEVPPPPAPPLPTR